MNIDTKYKSIKHNPEKLEMHDALKRDKDYLLTIFTPTEGQTLSETKMEEFADKAKSLFKRNKIRDSYEVLDTACGALVSESDNIDDEKNFYELANNDLDTFAQIVRDNATIETCPNIDNTNSLLTYNDKFVGKDDSFVCVTDIDEIKKNFKYRQKNYEQSLTKRESGEKVMTLTQLDEMLEDNTKCYVPNFNERFSEKYGSKNEPTTAKSMTRGKDFCEEHPGVCGGFMLPIWLKAAKWGAPIAAVITRLALGPEMFL